MELNEFEYLIIKEMSNKFNITSEQAGEIITKYLPVIRLLEDKYDSAIVQAERYYFADKENLSVEKWVEHINRTREKYRTNIIKWEDVKDIISHLRDDVSKFYPNIKENERQFYFFGVVDTLTKIKSKYKNGN